MIGRALPLLALLAPLAATPPALAQGPAAPRGFLARRYAEGETLHYRMEGTNQGRSGTTRYRVDADGVVRRDSLGRFFEEFEWSHLVQNDTAVRVAPSAARQRLTLATEYTIPPDLRSTAPVLVGPALDLLTFYVDLWLAAKLPLARAGDRIRVPGPGSTSWADGRSLLVGEDAVDFDVSLTAVDSTADVARVLVRHVPPEQARVRLPSEWMRAPAYGSPNNWVQVTRVEGGGYVAAVGRETFDVTLTVGLRDGKIRSAEMENPVDVLERSCADEALTSCGEPVRYRIMRRILLR